MVENKDPSLDNYKHWLSFSTCKHTADIYYSDAKKLLEYTKKRVNTIGLDDIFSYLNYLKEKGYKASSINRVIASIKRFLRVSGRTELAERLPTAKYGSAFNPVWLKPEQIVTLVNACKDGLQKAMIVTWYELALRRGEVVLLNRSWLNEETGEIKVVRLKRKRGNEDILAIRDEAFYGKPLKILLDYLDKRDDDNDAMFVMRDIIHGEYGRRITSRFALRQYHDVASRAGINIKRYKSHCLRHSRLTHMAIEQIQQTGHTDIARIAKFAGHTNISTTLIYTHLAGDYLLTRKGKHGESGRKSLSGKEQATKG